MNYRTTFSAGLLGMGLTLAFSSPWSLAQNTDPAAPGTATPPPNGSRRLRLNPGNGPANGNRAAELNLTPDQQQKFDAEMKDFQDKMQALRDEHDKRMAAFLTPEQMEKYRASQRNRGFGGPGGQGGPGAGNRGGGFGRQTPQEQLQSMKTELNLTADQESQIGKILQDAQTKMEALRGTVTDPNADRQALFTQMRSIRQDSNTKISAVLTPEQRQKWEASQQNRRGQGRGGRRGGNGGGGNGGGGNGGNGGGGNGV